MISTAESASFCTEPTGSSWLLLGQAGPSDRPLLRLAEHRSGDHADPTGTFNAGCYSVGLTCINYGNAGKASR